MTQIFHNNFIDNYYRNNTNMSQINTNTNVKKNNKSNETSQDVLLAKCMSAYIQNEPQLAEKFTRVRRVYLIENLFTALLYKLKSGISYREINNTEIKGVAGFIKPGALQYFFAKLAKLNFFELFFRDCVEKYINGMEEDLTKYDTFYVDSTLIANKLGIDSVTFNVQLKKHKSCKVSLVTDKFGVPIDCVTSNSNKHDAKLCLDHIKNIALKCPQLCDGTKTLIGDAAYHSSIIRDSLNTNNFGHLLCETNIRNTKDEQLLKQHKQINMYNKMLLASRSKIEHVNAIIKKNKQVNNRYDKYMINYKNYVFLALLKILHNKKIIKIKSVVKTPIKNKTTVKKS
jgi:hypothetical protein